MEVFAVRTVLSACIVLCGVHCSAPGSLQRSELAEHPDYVRVADIPGVRIDLRYASSNNFMGRNLYGSFRTCYLHRIAGNRLRAAVTYLRQERPGYSLVVYDGLRPRSVQRLMWAQVRGTRQQKYVANPARGSVHNFGMAVDLSIADARGRPLNMGGGFDDFTPRAAVYREGQLMKSGGLTLQQVANRRLLRRSMVRAGFIQLAAEWWHYDALPSWQVRRTFAFVE